MQKKLIKSLSAVLVLVMLISVCAVSSFTAIAVTSGDYEYVILEDGTAEISKYNGNETSVTIPSELDGIKVTSVGSFSFEKNKTVTNVVIPDSVTKIGSGSFRNCDSLAQISIPDTMTSLGTSAFAFCPSLDNVTIPNNVQTLAQFLFQNCTSLKTVHLPDSIKELPDFTFTGCTSLKDLSFLPAGLETIGSNSFSYCSFTNLVIPDGITTIKSSAFSYCSNLSGITIPDSVTTIDGYAFSSCTSLLEVTCPKTVTTIERMAFGYRFDQATWNDVPIEGFVLKGYTYSAAYDYANEYGIKFESIGEVPTKPTVPTEPSSTDPTTVPGESKTIYFKNSVKWNGVKAYIWDDTNGNGKVASWPGTAMTKCDTDSDGDDIYKIDVDVSKYDSIIFTTGTGSPQTVDIKLSSDVNAYYCTTSTGKYNVGSYTYKEVITTEPSTTEPTTTEPPTTEPPTTEPPTNPHKIMGDANGDGNLDIRDATCIQFYIANLPDNEIDLSVCDINEDGQVNIFDATQIQLILAQLI